MGTWSQRVTVGIVLWSLYSFLSVYWSVRIPKPLPKETLWPNKIKIGQDVDIHLYVASTPALPLESFRLRRDPNTPDRLIPSPTEQLCVPNRQRTVFHLLSFRSGYQSKHKIFGLFPTPGPVQSVSVCQHQTRAPDSTRNINPSSISNSSLQQLDSNSFRLGCALPKPLTEQLVPLYLHAFATRPVMEQTKRLRMMDVLLTLPVVQPLTTSITPDVFQRPSRYLLRDPAGQRQLAFLQQYAEEILPDGTAKDASILKRIQSIKLLSVPPEVTLSPVIYHDSFSGSLVSKMGLEMFIHTDPSSQQYLPPLLLNSLTSPRDEFVPLLGQSMVNIARHGAISNTTTTHNKDHEAFDLTVEYKPVGIKVWLLQHRFVNALNSLDAQWGFTAYDIDSLKLMMGGVNPVLMCATFIISFLHLLFSFLAVSSDVSFWNQHEMQAVAGISHLSIILEVMFSVAIAMHLWDVGQSKFVLLCVAGRVLFYLWKLSKIYGFRTRTTISGTLDKMSQPPRKDGDGMTELLLTTEEKKKEKEKIINFVVPQEDGVTGQKNETDWAEIFEFETKWMIRLSLLLIPVVLTVMLYQLTFVPQHGWKSWIIHSLALCSYAGGFVSMTPQLFRNYKLQSVDHLPWATLTYQALNAFVDDFFSFIIRMPTMHKVSVFRDDIVFIVYMVQRWLYRHPRKRVPENKIHVD